VGLPVNRSFPQLGCDPIVGLRAPLDGNIPRFTHYQSQLLIRWLCVWRHQISRLFGAHP
jgi:hypothetical protein